MALSKIQNISKFEMLKGLRLISPEDQEVIAAACRSHGWNGPSSTTASRKTGHDVVELTNRHEKRRIGKNDRIQTRYCGQSKKAELWIF